MEKDSSSLRAFIALPLDALTRMRIAQAMAERGTELPGLRWTAEAGLHVTLRFLGATTPRQVERISQSLARAARACPAGEARLQGLGLFPEKGSPRILWLGLVWPDAFFVLQAACERAAVEAGFAPEGRAFHPHLTLGRFRARAPRPALFPLDLGRTRLAQVVLFRSELNPRGAVYTPLMAFELKEGMESQA
jgi:2'-5' RNA ligase